MSEKRKPELKIVASVSGKRLAIELFPASLWPDRFRRNDRNKYRVRYRGRWISGDKVFTLSFIMNDLRRKLARSIKENRRQGRCNHIVESNKKVKRRSSGAKKTTPADAR